MAKDILAALREVCAALPAVEEQPPWQRLREFKVAGKTFAILAINHQGDGRIALWARAPLGAQQHYVDSAPNHYFVPRHVGAKGWLGVHLAHGNDWLTIAAHVREAYVQTAPAALRQRLGEMPAIEPPTLAIAPEEFDPLSAPHAQDALNRLRAWCATLPETSEGRQFGTPAFKAGKKTFLAVRRSPRLTVEVWVGAELQITLTDDPRFTLPRHLGHRGWIDLDIEDRLDFKEVRQLALGSYRHFALQRMLRTLDSQR